jgi:hypothetical protein
LLSSITQPNGATEVSQAVKANKASIVLSGDTPEKGELIPQPQYYLQFS